MQKKILPKRLEEAVPTKIKTRTNPTFDDTEIGQIFHSYFYLRQKPNELLLATILKALFNSTNFKTAASELFDGVKNSKAVCAKVFTKTDIAFKCYDCEKDPTCVICKECYEKGNHKGHRVLLQKSVSGCCDCGDPDAWNEKGFCCDHPGYANFKPTYSIDDIPADFRENFLQVIEKCFYYLFNLYEELRLCKQEDLVLMEAIDDVLKNIMGVLEFCGEKSLALWLLTCKLFKTKLSENKRELYANTTNLKEMSFHSINKLCDLTYFEALVFYHQLNSENIHNKLQNICIKLFVDYDFKIYMAETYIKMVHFIFYTESQENKEGEEPQTQGTKYSYTRLVGLDVQLFTAEEFAIIGINSEYFPAFLDLFEDLLKYCIRCPNYSSFETFMQYHSFFFYACQKTPSRQVLLYKEGAVKRILEALNTFNYCFKIDVTKKHSLNPNIVEDLIYLMEIEYKLLQIVDNLFVELSLEQNKAKRLEVALDLTEHFVNTIKRNDIKAFKESKEFNKFRSIHIPYYRAFTLFVKNLVEEPTSAALEKLLKVDLKMSDRNIEIIFLFLFQIALRTMTFTIDNEKKIWEFYSPIFDVFSSMYKNPKLKLLDCDLLLLQYSLCFIHPEDFSMVLETSASVTPSYLEIFKSINTGKFDKAKFQKGVQEIQKGIKKGSNADLSPLSIFKRTKSSNEESCRGDIALDEFFNILVQLCTDQVSLANLFYQKTKMFENVKHPEFCRDVYKDVVVNLLQKQTKMNFKTIKEVLSNRVVQEKADLESGLNQIATFNTQSKTFQLKDKYLNVYEPFIFMKDPQLFVETQEAVKNRLKLEKKQCDLIVGNSSYVYEYRYSMLDKIQGRLFEFPITEFAVNCFINCGHITKTNGLIARPILKYLHLALSHALHFKKHSLLTSLSKLLGTKEFADQLKDLRADASVSEFHPGIDKIIQLIGEVQQKCSVEGVEIVSPVGNVEDKLKMNQEAIQLRMVQLKKQFSEKRENFLKKFKEEIKDDESTEENMVCYICHLNIGPDTEYGIPAYFSESSLYNLAFAQCKSTQKANHGHHTHPHGHVHEEFPPPPKAEESKIEDVIPHANNDDDWESEDEDGEDFEDDDDDDDEHDDQSQSDFSAAQSSEQREEEKVPEEEEKGPEKAPARRASRAKLEHKAYSSYPVVTSCSHNFHYIHKECFEKSSRKRTGNTASFVFSSEMEFSCSFCKSLCNIFISENSFLHKKQEETAKNNIELEINDIKSVLETTEQLKQVPSNHMIVPDLIFNDIMLLQVFKEDQQKVDKESSTAANEDHILVTFDKLLAQCCHTVIFGGLEYFIKYSYNLYKLLQTSYKQFYKAHISSTKTQYFENKKNLLVKYLDLLLTGESHQETLEDQVDQVLFRDSKNSKIALFATPDEFIFESLQHLVISSELTTQLTNLFIMKVMRIYLLHKLVQVYVKEKLLKETKEHVTLDSFQKDLTLGMNSTIKAELVNGILPTVKKIVVFILLNTNDTSKDIVQTIAKGDYLNDEEELNAYLKVDLLDTTAEALLSSEIFDYSGVSSEIVKTWINGSHRELTKGVDSLTPYILMSDQEVRFSFVELPENYYALSMYYIEQKCEMCNNRSESGNQCVCLLCGTVLCNFSCSKKKFINGQRGNLNAHSLHYHAGESAFLNVESGTVFLIKSPKNVDFGPLYIDRLGYAIEDKGKDWRQFKLDKSRLETLREKFVYEKVAQEVTYNILNNNKKYYDNML